MVKPKALLDCGCLAFAGSRGVPGCRRALASQRCADDGRVYAQFARNLLERQVYTHETEAPYDPSFIRLRAIRFSSLRSIQFLTHEQWRCSHLQA